MTSPKRKLLVVLGAGSSIPCGMPSVTDINGKMKEWCREWILKSDSPTDGANGVFTDLWSTIEEYYLSHSQQQYGIHVDFEKVLGEMIALASWVSPSPFGDPLSKAVRDAEPLARFKWPIPPPDEPFFHRHMILDQLAHLLGKLAEYMREHSKTLNKEAPEFKSYRDIFSRLRDEFDVGIYNLNYDNVARSAWPEAYTGFREGNFDARAVGVRSEWGFIYHLHGSVHYSFSDNPPFAPVLTWQDDLQGGFDENRPPLMTNMAGAFKPIVRTTLIAGGFKLDQLLSDPFQMFYASLIRHAHEADAVLIAGYGFGDVHVNRALHNRCSRYPFERSRRPPVVVLTKSSRQTQSTGQRQSHDFWAHELTHTLNTKFRFNPAKQSDNPSIEQLIDQQMLEMDSNGHLGIWHGGFLECLGCFDKIVTQLRHL